MEKIEVGQNSSIPDIADDISIAALNIGTQINPAKFPFLQQLALLSEPSFSNQQQPNQQIKRPVTIDALEMLEAELRNQGILDISEESLAKHARHQINLLSWQARRLMLPLEDVEFLIDMRALILKLAFQALGDSSSPIQFNSETSENHLRYLEQFSAYLVGLFETPRNRYEQGLNLILKAIAAAGKPDKTKETRCVIPISKSAFVELVKQR